MALVMDKPIARGMNENGGSLGDQEPHFHVNPVGPERPFLPSFKEGGYVPETGPALLHKGEHVIPKEHADKMRLAAVALGHHEGKPKKELKHVLTRKVKGGHIHEHHFTHPEHHAPEEHVSQGNDGLVAHMLEHQGEPNPGEAEADQGQSGIEPQVGE